MAMLNIIKNFTFVHPDGKREAFFVGKGQEVPDHVAQHWYALAHSDQAPKIEPQIGSLEYAAHMRALVGKRQAALAEAMEFLAEAEKAMDGSASVEPSSVAPTAEAPSDVEPETGINGQDSLSGIPRKRLNAKLD